MSNIKQNDMVRIRNYRGKKYPNLWIVVDSPTSYPNNNSHVRVRNVVSKRIRSPKSNWWGNTGITRLEDLIKVGE